MSPKRYKFIFILIFINVTSIRSADANNNDQVVAESNNLSEIVGRPVFSPRMEYNEWLPVGRGDPLKNDPTYDYSPPVLERVRYWSDNNANKDKGNDILLLGVSSKKSTSKKESMFGPVKRNFYTQPNMEIPTVLMPPPMHNHHQKENSWIQTPAGHDGAVGFGHIFRLATALNKPNSPYVLSQYTGSKYHQNQNQQQQQHQQSYQQPQQSQLQSHLQSQPQIQHQHQHQPQPQPQPQPQQQSQLQKLLQTTPVYRPDIKPTTSNSAYKKPFLHTILQNESAFPFTKTAVTSTITKYTANYYNPETINAMAQTVKPPPQTTELQLPTNYVTTSTTMAPPSMTTDPLFAHYKQPAQPMKGPLYLIIEGHSKVKTYGLNHNITINRAPIIKPVGSPDDPVVRHVVNEEDGKNMLVKHLHTKPDTERVIIQPKTETGTTAMDNLLSLLDSSFGNYLLDDDSKSENSNTIDGHESNKRRDRKTRSLDNQQGTFVIATFEVDDGAKSSNTPYYYRKGYVENAVTPTRSKTMYKR